MGEIKPLTAMRGIFAMWVVFFHIGMWAPRAHDQIPIVSRGYIAVDFFFILSGFILARAHAIQFSIYRFPTHLKFVFKRILRLFPLHWVTLAALIVAMMIQGTPLYWRGYIIDEAVLIHRWGFSHSPRAVINGPDWSISTEWAANLLYPVFIWLVMGNRLRATSTVFVSIGALYYIAIHNSWALDFSFARSFIPLTRCFAEFAIGIACYRAGKYASVWSSDWVVGALLMTDLLLVAIPSTDLIVVATIPFLILGLSASNGRIANTLASKPLHWLGTVSYSIYLIQYPVILLALWMTPETGNSGIDNFLFTVIVIALIWSCSHLTHKFIEVGAQQLFRRRTDTRSEQNIPATVSP